ncbi:hypothetical protein IGI04_004139 [Brassica rapa subsp. trilocularis]|uniref:RNase H type-1 domain-containing protein n=1 Tax=Brassica rapa subsp. trilocularis TaxID=1813537 RepID=A0ABQ7P0F8_BRACM|nr:hypothetical protein IGI04_004139 [Brassica rapa subsp. trilocularis]
MDCDFFSDYLRQRKDLAGDGVLQLLEKSSYGSTLFTSVTTNSSRRNKELLEKETIPMETESTRTGKIVTILSHISRSQNRDADHLAKQALRTSTVSFPVFQPLVG